MSPPVSRLREEPGRGRRPVPVPVGRVGVGSIRGGQELGGELPPAHSAVRAVGRVVEAVRGAVFGFVVAARVREDGLQLEQQDSPEPAGLGDK